MKSYVIISLQIVIMLVISSYALSLSSVPIEGSYDDAHHRDKFTQLMYDDPLLLDHSNITELMEFVYNLWTIEIMKSTGSDAYK